MAKSIGRPPKYRYLLEQLLDDELYTAAAVVRFAEALGTLDLPNGANKKLIRSRVRISLGRFSHYHFFPREGDGLLVFKGQPATAAWLGSRWKEALPENQNSCYQPIDLEAVTPNTEKICQPIWL